MEYLLLAALSLDGRLADAGGNSFSSPEDKEHFFQSVRTCDGMVFGASTYRKNPVWMTESLRPGAPRVVATRNPDQFKDDMHPDRVFLPPDPAIHEDYFRSRGCRRIAVLGGGSVYAAYLAADRVDRLLLTLEPVVLGEGPVFAAFSVRQRYTLLSTRPLNTSTLLLEYKREGSSFAK